MFPPRCGGWIHIPNEVGSNTGQPVLLLKAIGFRWGRECRKHPDWFHAHPPTGWQYRPRDDEGCFVVLDAEGRSRVKLVGAQDGEPAVLMLFPYYRLFVEPTISQGRLLLVCTIVDGEGGTAYTALQFVSAPNPRAMGELAAMVLNDFTRSHPEVSNPLAYWD